MGRGHSDAFGDCAPPIQWAPEPDCPDEEWYGEDEEGDDEEEEGEAEN